MQPTPELSDELEPTLRLADLSAAMATCASTDPGPDPTWDEDEEDPFT